MLEKIQKNWWKILSVLLLLYTFVVGFLVPLKTGVADVSPRLAELGKPFVLQVKGYNSHYNSYKNVRIWLKMDSSHALAAKSVKILNDTHLEATFQIPTTLPTTNSPRDLSLVIDDAVDGYSILPTAVFVNGDSSLVGAEGWNLQISDTHKAGLSFPYRNILYESIRNTFFHVPMWFVMFAMFGMAIYYSIKYLQTRDLVQDTKAVAYTQVGVLFGLLGLFTGAIWAKNTWGEYFPFEIKILMTYAALAIYLAYFLLRMSFESLEQKARISAVYSIFAFASLVPLLYVIPKLSTSSLHPGNGGNQTIGAQDLDNTMRMVFYPASIGWILLGFWIATLVYRTAFLQEKLYEK